MIEKLIAALLAVIVIVLLWKAIKAGITVLGIIAVIALLVWIAVKLLRRKRK